MDASGPICGRNLRLQWLRAALARQLEKPTVGHVSRQDIVGWFLRSGRASGFSREELVRTLHDDDECLRIAERLQEPDILAGKPPPDFAPGQSVEVVLNARNTTYRRGSIADAVWHGEDDIWRYWIAEDGKRVPRAYEARDLRAIAAAAVGHARD